MFKATSVTCASPTMGSTCKALTALVPPVALPIPKSTVKALWVLVPVVSMGDVKAISKVSLVVPESAETT